MKKVILICAVLAAIAFLGSSSVRSMSTCLSCRAGNGPCVDACSTGYFENNGQQTEGKPTPYVSASGERQ